nr:MAG TPA_asm: hypothetical protein [Bacteriophage sp.]
MARTKANADTEAVKTAEVKDATIEQSAVQQENDELKKQLDELKAQMALMAQMMANKPATVAKSNKQIKFINLSSGSAILRGTVMWKITGQFADKDFDETEANIIVANMGNMIRSGRIYIADQDFVESHNLGEVYKHILNVDQLKSLFDKDGKTIIEAYKMANDAQKQIIVDMISERKVNGQFVDANAAIEIGKLCGKDLMAIEPDDE